MSIENNFCYNNREDECPPYIFFGQLKIINMVRFVNNKRDKRKRR